MKYFFDADKPHWAAWLQLYRTDVCWDMFNYKPTSGGSPLYYASLCGFYALVEHLVAKHPMDVTAEGGRNKTPLVAALSGNHLRVAELLHQHGSDVDVQDEDNQTPLFVASWCGLVGVAEWLVNHGADVNARQYLLLTPLSVATIKGHSKIVRMLLDHKADVNARSMNGWVALHEASHPYDTRDQLDIMRLLLEYGADANARNNDGTTPLHRSICGVWSISRQPSLEVIRLLLKYGANVALEDNGGKTALQLASAKGYHEIVELLSESGPSEGRTQALSKHNLIIPIQPLSTT
jgi:uncharacterized protein